MNTLNWREPMILGLIAGSKLFLVKSNKYPADKYRLTFDVCGVFNSGRFKPSQLITNCTLISRPPSSLTDEELKAFNEITELDWDLDILREEIVGFEEFTLP